VMNAILLKMARTRKLRMSLVMNVKSTIVEAMYPVRSVIVIMALNPFSRLLPRACSSRDSLGLRGTKCREEGAKKFQNVPEIGSNQPMATIYAFGPFRLDVEAEILFRTPSPPSWGNGQSPCCARWWSGRARRSRRMR